MTFLPNGCTNLISSVIKQYQYASFFLKLTKKMQKNLRLVMSLPKSVFKDLEKEGKVGQEENAGDQLSTLPEAVLKLWS